MDAVNGWLKPSIFYEFKDVNGRDSGLPYQALRIFNSNAIVVQKRAIERFESLSAIKESLDRHPLEKLRMFGDTQFDVLGLGTSFPIGGFFLLHELAHVMQYELLQNWSALDEYVFRRIVPERIFQLERRLGTRLTRLLVEYLQNWWNFWEQSATYFALDAMAGCISSH
jgi:hypothetical protein